MKRPEIDFFSDFYDLMVKREGYVTSKGRDSLVQTMKDISDKQYEFLDKKYNDSAKIRLLLDIINIYHMEAKNDFKVELKKKSEEMEEATLNMDYMSKDILKELKSMKNKISKTVKAINPNIEIKW